MNWVLGEVSTSLTDGFRKHNDKRRKIPVTSIFSCFHNVSLGIEDKSQESDVQLVKIDECQPKWSLSIINYRSTRNATDFGSKFNTTITENHL